DDAVGVLGHHGRDPRMDELAFIHKGHSERLVELHEESCTPRDARYAFRRRETAGPRLAGAAGRPASSAARGSGRAGGGRSRTPDPRARGRCTTPAHGAARGDVDDWRRVAAARPATRAPD